MSLSLGEPLPSALLDAEVLDTSGEALPLRRRLSDGPTLLVFVRQFGCASCGERTAELLLHGDALAAAGVRVLLVGCGSVEDAREFADARALDTHPVDVLTDPTLTVHRAAGLLRSYWGVLGVRAGWNILRALGQGHENVWGKGDFYQLGGTVLIDADGIVRVHHQEHHVGATLPLGAAVEQSLAILARRASSTLKLP